MWKYSSEFVNSFDPNAAFLYPLKTSENRKEIRKKTLCVQGVENGCNGNEWVKQCNSPFVNMPNSKSIHFNPSTPLLCSKYIHLSNGHLFKKSRFNSHVFFVYRLFVSTIADYVGEFIATLALITKQGKWLYFFSVDFEGNVFLLFVTKVLWK